MQLKLNYCKRLKNIIHYNINHLLTHSNYSRVPVTENFPLYTSLLKAIAERTTTPKRFDTVSKTYNSYCLLNKT